MQPDTRHEIVSRLRSLVDENPEQAMQQLESLLRCSSVLELVQILFVVYAEVSEEMGIDWHFTALQWELGNCGGEQFLAISRQSRFMVWSFAFQKEGDAGSETRYTTCLPFCFRPEWLTHGARAARSESSM